MRFAAISVLIVLALSAQTKPKFEICGLGHHECSCLRRTQAIQGQRYEVCVQAALKSDGSTDEKALRECNKKIPDHCTMAELVQPEDGDTKWKAEGQGFVGEEKMGEFCTMACKLHDCTCDDGPVCHFGHHANDHN